MMMRIPQVLNELLDMDLLEIVTLAGRVLRQLRQFGQALQRESALALGILFT